MSVRLALAVAGLWTFVAILAGAQASLAAALQGEAEPLGAAIIASLTQLLPWIPATLVAITLAGRLPLARATWRRNLPLHVLAVPFTALLTNLLVVSGYCVRSGRFDGFGALVQQAAFWGLVRLHIALLLYAATVAATTGFRSWRRLRAREVELARLEAQLANARLQVLSAQIRPHFLFNTLHTIGQLWRSGRSREADAMLDHLGSLFQKVIASTSRTQVPLSEELAMVRDYLAIEEARFGDRVKSRLTAEDEALACLVPPLLLQPIVENAVKHGLAPSASGGSVCVEARVVGKRLVLVVRDDGAGADGVRGVSEGLDEEAEGLREAVPRLPAVAAGPGAGTHGPRETQGTGTGLSNVRERLAALYGPHQRIETASGPHGGTEVLIELPATTEDSPGA